MYYNNSSRCARTICKNHTIKTNSLHFKDKLTKEQLHLCFLLQCVLLSFNCYYYNQCNITVKNNYIKTVYIKRDI